MAIINLQDQYKCLQDTANLDFSLANITQQIESAITGVIHQIGTSLTSAVVELEDAINTNIQDVKNVFYQELNGLGGDANISICGNSSSYVANDPKAQNACIDTGVVASISSITLTNG